MKIHDNKKHPYLRSGFWINNKYWDNESYSEKSKKELDKFHKTEVEKYKNKGHIE